MGPTNTTAGSGGKAPPSPAKKSPKKKPHKSTTDSTGSKHKQAAKGPRKKSSSTKSKKLATAVAVTSTTTTVAAASSRSNAVGIGSNERSPLALPTLILDSGGWTVKHGTVVPTALHAETDAQTQSHNDVPSIGSETPSPLPRQSPNATAKPKHQLTILAADETETAVRNQSQLEFTRPLERGYPTDLATQLRVWRRICSLEGIAVRSTTAGAEDAASASGGAKRRKRHGGSGAPDTADGSGIPPPTKLASSNCRLMMLTQPFTPRSISERIDEVCYDDLGFDVVGKIMIQCASAARYLDGLVRPTRDDGGDGDTMHDDASADGGRLLSDDGTRCCLVVDSGFSLTHVVPTFECRAVSAAIRRLSVGGRMISNLLKEWVSYRQWNLMDEFPIVNEAKEALCYVVPSSGEYDDEMRKARRIRLGYRDFDREFVLPDFVSAFKGSVRLAAGLRKKKDHEERRQMKKELKKKMKQRMESKEEKAKIVDDDQGSTNEKGSEDNRDIDEQNDDEVDSDEETDAQRLRRIQRQKEEERRRRELEEESRQALTVSVERFAAPEILFRPDDVGLDQGGIAETIVQSVQACPAKLRAAMYRNVLLTGGNALIPGFAERLERELRSLAPSNYEVRVCLPHDPVSYAWKGAQHIAARECRGADDAATAFQECFVDRAQWMASKESGDTDIRNGMQVDDGMTLI
mmetsp:Transcript_16498/g.36623  ORF Transcript_16498/g.36623 Transcript_16498/m.36623 type:complete len:692 (+) Transcript_16498:80-2155(+)